MAAHATSGTMTNHRPPHRRSSRGDPTISLASGVPVTPWNSLAAEKPLNSSARQGRSSSNIQPMRFPRSPDLEAPTPRASWSHSPLIALAILWTTVWSMVSSLEITGYIHDPAIPWWQPFAIVSISSLIVALWLFFELRGPHYFRRPLDPPRAWFLGQLPRLPLLAVGYIVTAFGIRHLVFAVKQADYWHLPWSIVIPYELVKISLFYCLWLGLVYGTLSLLCWRERGEQLVAMQKTLAEAQLARLRAQLRPHFLFNTLNTVSSLMQSDVVRADRVLSRLGDLLRATLGAGEHDTVSLREEIHVLHLYADIMEERFPGRIVM